ncbi:MAG: hypothetical protein K0R78_491 [Pelosinus sp.]|jgi:hypothetical protein|nr:hypothetical protein [Pelosinus sp.]
MNQRGSATILGIGIMVILLILIAGLMPMLINDVKFGRINRDAIEAQYAAEAGAKRAIAEFNRNNPDWGWLNSNRTFVDDVDFTKNYNVIIYLASDASHTPIDLPNLMAANHYVIQSKGTVGKASRTVLVSVDVSSDNGGNISGNVFSKYTTYSREKMQIDNNPAITGDVGSGSTITVNSSSELIHGTAYTPIIPVMDQYTWNRNAVAGGYRVPTSPDTLAISIPALPSITASGTNLSTITGSATLAGGSYFSTGDYKLSGTSLTATAGEAVTLHINGNLNLTSGKKSASNIIGDNITIYVTGNIIMDNASTIQAVNNGKVKIYTEGSLQLTNTAAINGEKVTIVAQKDINFNSDSSINKTSTSAITEIYSYGKVELTNQFAMGGNAALVAATNRIELNSKESSDNTVFVSGSGASQITNQVKLAGFYTNGSLNINSQPTITYKAAVIKALGLDGSGGTGGGATSTITFGNWKSL